MKLPILLLCLTGFAKASLNEVLVRHPGGIGGIFKGPNLETIVKGPDGSVITSQQEGAEVRTDLEAVTGGAVVPHSVIPVAEDVDEVVPAHVAVAVSSGVAPSTANTGVVEGATAASPVLLDGGVVGEVTLSTVDNAEETHVSGLPSITEPGRITIRPLQSRLRPLPSIGDGLTSGVPTVVSTATSAGGWGQINTAEQGLDVHRATLPSSTLSPVELDLPSSSRNLEAVGQLSPAVPQLELGFSAARGNLRLSNEASVGLYGGNVAVSGNNVGLSTASLTSTYSPSELALSSVRGNLELSNNVPVGLNSGNVQLSASNIVSPSKLPTSTYSPLELDLSSLRGNLELSNSPVGLNGGNVPLSASNIVSPTKLPTSTYSPSELNQLSVRGNLELSNNVPVGLNSGNVPLSVSNIVSPTKLPTSPYSPSELDLSSLRGNLELSNNAPVDLNSANVPLSSFNIVSPTKLTTSTYSPLELDLSSVRGNLELSNYAPVGLNSGNVPLSASNIVSPTKLPTSTYSPSELDLSSVRGNLELSNNAPVGLNGGNVPLSAYNIVSPTKLPTTAYSPSELGLSSASRENLGLRNEAPVVVSSRKAPLPISYVFTPTGLPTSTNPSLKLDNSPSNGLPPRSDVLVRVPSSTISPQYINLRPSDVTPITSTSSRIGNLPNNEFQTVPAFAGTKGQQLQAQPNDRRLSVEPSVFPINVGDVSSTNLQVDRASVNIIPPEIRAPGVSRVNDEVRGRLYYGNGQSSDEPAGLLRDTNPVGRSGTSPSTYEDTSEVLANRYGKRRT